MVERIGFGIRLKKVRELMNMKQTELAKLLGVRSTYISRLETGSSNPSDSLIRLIASSTLVNYEWLKNGTGEMGNISTEEEIRDNSRTFSITDKDVQIVDKIKPKSIEDYAIVNSLLSSFYMIVEVEDSINNENKLKYYRCTDEILRIVSKLCTVLKLQSEEIDVKDKKKFCNEQTEKLKKIIEEYLL